MLSDSLSQSIRGEYSPWCSMWCGFIEVDEDESCKNCELLDTEKCPYPDEYNTSTPTIKEENK